MTVDQQPGADQLGKRLGVFLSIVASPNELKDRAALEKLAELKFAHKHIRVEAPLVTKLGNAVGNEQPAVQSHRQRTALQKLDKRLTHLLGGLAVHVLQTQPKSQIEHPVILLNGVIGHLGQFVVAQDEVDPIREFQLQSGHVFEHGM